MGGPDLEDAKAAVQETLVGRDPATIAPGTLAETLRPLGLNGPQVREVVQALYAEALTTFLHDGVLSDREVAYLSGLRKAFGMSQTELDALDQRVVHPRYLALLAQVASDGRIDTDERLRLERFREAAKLPDAVAQRLFQEKVGSMVLSAMSQAVADRRLSDSEWQDLTRLAEHLGCALSTNENTSRTLDRFRALWRIENGELPEIPVPIELEKGEVCHFAAATDWHEWTSVTRPVDPGGVGIPIVKGVRFRLGSIAPIAVRSDELRKVDQGTLYITNRRVFYDGEGRKSTIRLSKLDSFRVFGDAIVLDEEQGKSPHLFIRGDVELAAVILSAVLAQA